MHDAWDGEVGMETW